MPLNDPATLPHLRFGKGSASEASRCHTTTPLWGVGVGHGGNKLQGEVWQTLRRGEGFSSAETDADHYARTREGSGAAGRGISQPTTPRRIAVFGNGPRPTLIQQGPARVVATPS